MGERSHKLCWEWQPLGGIPVPLSSRGGREPGMPEDQPRNYCGIRIFHGPVMPWGLGTGKLQGCAISGSAEPWQAAWSRAWELAEGQLCQAAHTGNGNTEFSGSLDLGLDHWIDLTKDIHTESVPGLGLWDSPRGFSHSRKLRVSIQPVCRPAIVFLDGLEVGSRSCKWSGLRPACWLFPLQQISTHYCDVSSFVFIKWNHMQ